MPEQDPIYGQWYQRWERQIGRLNELDQMMAENGRVIERTEECTGGENGHYERPLR
jgi:hypothetical protein